MDELRDYNDEGTGSHQRSQPRSPAAPLATVSTGAAASAPATMSGMGRRLETLAGSMQQLGDVMDATAANTTREGGRRQIPRYPAELAARPSAASSRGPTPHNVQQAGPHSSGRGGVQARPAFLPTDRAERGSRSGFDRGTVQARPAFPPTDRAGVGKQQGSRPEEHDYVHITARPALPPAAESSRLDPLHNPRGRCQRKRGRSLSPGAGWKQRLDLPIPPDTAVRRLFNAAPKEVWAYGRLVPDSRGFTPGSPEDPSVTRPSSHYTEAEHKEWKTRRESQILRWRYFKIMHSTVCEDLHHEMLLALAGEPSPLPVGDAQNLDNLLQLRITGKQHRRMVGGPSREARERIHFRGDEMEQDMATAGMDLEAADAERIADAHLDVEEDPLIWDEASSASEGDSGEHHSGTAGDAAAEQRPPPQTAVDAFSAEALLESSRREMQQATVRRQQAKTQLQAAVERAEKAQGNPDADLDIHTVDTMACRRRLAAAEEDLAASSEAFKSYFALISLAARSKRRKTLPFTGLFSEREEAAAATAARHTANLAADAAAATAIEEFSDEWAVQQARISKSIPASHHKTKRPVGRPQLVEDSSPPARPGPPGINPYDSSRPAPTPAPTTATVPPPRSRPPGIINPEERQGGKQRERSKERDCVVPEGGFGARLQPATPRSRREGGQASAASTVPGVAAGPAVDTSVGPVTAARSNTEDKEQRANLSPAVELGVPLLPPDVLQRSKVSFKKWWGKAGRFNKMGNPVLTGEGPAIAPWDAAYTPICTNWQWRGCQPGDPAVRRVRLVEAYDRPHGNADPVAASVVADAMLLQLWGQWLPNMECRWDADVCQGLRARAEALRKLLCSMPYAMRGTQNVHPKAV